VLIGDLLEGDNEISGQGLKVFLDRIGYFIFPPLGGLLATIAWFWPLFFTSWRALGVSALFCMPRPKATTKDSHLYDMLRPARHPRLWSRSRRVAFSTMDSDLFPLFLCAWYLDGDRGLLYVFFSAGAMITASQAGRIAAGRDKAHILFIAFVVSGAAVVAVPFVPGIWLVGCALFFYGLANGVISPMQKSLLTQNAPTELRGGIVSFDRLIQQVSKTTSTTVVGLLLVTAELPTIFWMLGILSFASVALMALLLPVPRPAVASPGAS
jgi:predicted MFS family arabinose efflux permease